MSPPTATATATVTTATATTVVEAEDAQGRSKFNYRHLQQLARYSVDSPFRVVALVDLDAFYAQCEMKRLGVSPEQPLAVQQWQNLIAVNYPSREKGVSRHITSAEARKLCPDIQLVHVATWKAGKTTWSYGDGSSEPDMATSKACLDPYRAESKKILSIFQSVCPNARTERASIDESFLDLSRDIHDQLLLRYPVLRGAPPDGDYAALLPAPPKGVVLNWSESHLVTNVGEDEETREMLMEEVDWDDVAMAIGAEITRGLRDEVFTQLGYTCSAGVAGNKMIAKLGAGFKKPNQQSVVRPSAVEPFLATFKFTKIRNLGGKLGTQIAEHFKTESLTELLSVSLASFQSLLSDDTATWVYNTIRGHDRSAVEPKSGIKSMLSAKSFRDPLPSSIAAAQLWIKVFIADICSRLEDEGVMDGRRRPKTMTISFTNKHSGSRNKQVSIPPAGKIGAEMLARLAEGLLRQVAGEPGVWPCTGLSLQVAGIQDREEGNRGIGAFLIKGDKAREANKRLGEGAAERLPTEEKRRKVDIAGRFFAAPAPVHEDGGGGGGHAQALEATAADAQPTFRCPDCGAEIPAGDEDEHKDWHFARSLMLEDRAATARERVTQVAPPVPKGKASGSSSSGGAGAGAGAGAGGKGKRGRKDPKKLEKGQRKLAF